MVGVMYGYSDRKAAQVAAYFVLRAGGRMNVLKLAKLLYLAERESMARFDEPLFYDKLVSMDHGPVTSISLNHVNGMLQSDNWQEFIAGRAGYEVGSSDGLAIEQLDHLGRAEIRLLDDLWQKFGHMGHYELRDWTHANCLEWENPHGSSEPIPHDRVYKFLGKSNADELAEAVHSHRMLARSIEAAC
jgi:uncharacterized phage-associated protein